MIVIVTPTYAKLVINVEWKNAFRPALTDESRPPSAN